jgi:enoyl-CoA hydratase
MSEAEVICQKTGRCGRITLNRPRALNALTLPMVREIAAALDRWESDPAIASVVITGSGGKAFCAGGDIRVLYNLGKAGRYEDQLNFWREEYRLNRRIKRYAKPYLAIVDGIVMGGGAGISVHGASVIAGENFSFAMPETGIGFVPDVGATYFLPRLPARSGLYLALTGARLTCADALAFDVASVHVPSARHSALIERLAQGEPLQAAVAAEHAAPPASVLLQQSGLVAHCFAPVSLPAILDNLDAEARAGSEFARSAACAIRAKSPMSLAITLRQMAMGAKMDIDQALQTEFRIAARLARGNDYYEGVRAAIIDKHNHPRWSPASADEIQEEDIDAYFAPLPEVELEF